MTNNLRQKLALQVRVQKNQNHHRCIVLNCPSIGERRQIRYFRLPADEQRRNQWLANCDRLDLRSHSAMSLHNKLLCQLHFRDSQFMNVHTYNRLIWNAVPTLFGKDTRKVEEFEEHKAGVRTDHAYTTQSPVPSPTSTPVPMPALPPAQSSSVEQPSTQLPPPASSAADPLRHYMLLCAELKREVAEKNKKLQALEKCSDSIMDNVTRLVKTLPREKQQQLASSLASLVHLRSYGHTSQEPRVRVEVLLLSREHPGCTLLGLRTRSSWASGLYMAPGDFLHFGESWEAAAVRATKQETGLSLLEPCVCSVVETLETSQGHHWVNIFMAGKVAELGTELTAPKEAVCTDYVYCKAEVSPSDPQLALSCSSHSYFIPADTFRSSRSSGEPW
ncbi:uncharacterized protein LOC144125084 isoform X3 [Amblyomma americanum]